MQTNIYEIEPTKYVNKTHIVNCIEVCPEEEAEQWSVYFRGDDGLAMWRADFLLRTDAEIFTDFMNNFMRGYS